MLWSQFIGLTAAAVIGAGISLTVAALMRNTPWWATLAVLLGLTIIGLVIANSMGGQRIY
jgi:hypothetical protein